MKYRLVKKFGSKYACVAAILKKMDGKLTPISEGNRTAKFRVFSATLRELISVANRPEICSSLRLLCHTYRETFH